MSVESPLWAVLALWMLAGDASGRRARVFGVTQSGLYAAKGLGILASGAVAQPIGAPLAVGLAGLTTATMLAMSWTHLRGRLIQARPNGPESPWPRLARSAAC